MKNPEIVGKLSETGLERSSRALDKSGRIKIALRIQWKASRTPKTTSKVKKSKYIQKLPINRPGGLYVFNYMR